MDAVIRISGLFAADMMEMCVNIKPSPAYEDSSIGRKLAFFVLGVNMGVGLGFLFCGLELLWLAVGEGIANMR